MRGRLPQYKTALIRNSLVGAREKDGAPDPFETICDFMSYSHEVSSCQPDPQIFTLACEKFGLQSHELLFVNDHQEVYVTAVAMAMYCREFKENAQVMAEIENCLRTNF